MWSALYPISNHSHIRQLQFATHAFSQQVLQQAVQISICQWSQSYHIITSYRVSTAEQTRAKCYLFVNYQNVCVHGINKPEFNWIFPIREISRTDP